MISSPLLPITLDRSLHGCESGFWRARASQNRAALRSEAFFTLGTRTNIWGIINANGHGAAAGRRVFCCFSRHARMARSQPVEPTKFNYDQDDEAVVLSVEFPNDQEAEAFAGRFDRKEPPGLTPFGV